MGTVVLAVPGRVPLGVSSAALFAVVAVAVAVLAQRRPAFGAAALIALEPFAWAHDAGPTQVTIPKVALIGLIAGLALRRASLGVLADARARPLVTGAIATVAATAISVLPAIYVDAVARETLKALEYTFAFAAVAVALANDDDERAISLAVIASATIACVAALAQEAMSAPSGALINGIVVPRIAGPLDGPNQLAGYLDLIIPFALAIALPRGPLRLPAFALLVLAIVTDVLTLSRAGLLGAIVGAGIVVAARAETGRIPRRFALAGSLLLLALAGVATRLGFASRFLSVDDVERNNGLATRAELWPAAMRLFASDPAFGIGAGNYELRLPSAGLIGVRTHANSLYLQTLAEGGIALFAATVWTIGGALALCLRNRRSTLLVGIAGGTAALASHQIFDLLVFFPKIGGTWWALLGVAAGLVYARPAAR